MADRSMWSMGTVQGIHMLCHETGMVNSVGIWFNDNPLNFSLPLLLIDIIIVFLTSRFTYFFLRPLRQSLFISQMITGVLLGGTLFRDPRKGVISGALFPTNVGHIIRTLGDFGMTLHMFKLGLQINPRMLRTTHRKDVAIGLFGFLVPFLFGLPAIGLFSSNQIKEVDFAFLVPMVLTLNSVTSFVVVTSLLNHLKILNSELGRLASSASMVSEALAWLVRFIFYNLVVIKQHSKVKLLLIVFITLGYYYLLFFLVRPLILWVIRRNPDGKTVSENQLMLTMILVLSAAFLGEYIGQTASFTAFVFGVSLPDGPPLGTQWEKRFDVIISGLLVPIYYVMGAGIRVNPRKMILSWSSKEEILLLMCYVAKFVGTFLPALWFKMPLLESTVLSLIMSCKGILEISIYVKWMDQRIISHPMYSLLVVNLIVVTGLFTPMISRLYDPSRRYKALTRRSILEAQTSSDLRVLVSVHNEDNVSPIINFLEASNPTRGSPLTVLVLQLMELAGRAAAILAPHHNQHAALSLTRSEHIVNAFNQLEKRSRGNVLVQHFTAVAPYASMHDDVCTLALDKRANIVIIPFHKQWGIDGEAENFFPQIRVVNQNVMQKSPCSVGILIDRSLVQSNRQRSVGTIHSSYHITMFFLGSFDDYEALALATRMAKHPNVHLTVVQIRSKDDDCMDCSQDDLMGIPNSSATGKKIVYKEETVEDGEGTIQAIQKMEGMSDLVIVGKHQKVDSDVVSGLKAWGECPELGVLGDLMATSDFSFSVLVVQKQPMMCQL